MASGIGFPRATRPLQVALINRVTIEQSDRTTLNLLQLGTRRLEHENTCRSRSRYTFRVRQAPTRDGTSMFNAFLPAVSRDALKAMGSTIRDWRIHLRNTTDLAELAMWINPIVRGWMTYYGKFYRTALYPLLRRINTYLVRWARRKFKRLRSFKRARRWWNVGAPGVRLPGATRLEY